MITLLMIIIASTIVLQCDLNRFASALIFAAITIGFDELLGDVSGEWYFLYGALADLLVIVLLASLPRPTTLCIRLIYISLIFIILQYIGWQMWYLYQPSTLYESLATSLYIISIGLLIYDNKGDDDDAARLDNIWTSIYRHITTRHLSNHNGGTKTCR